MIVEDVARAIATADLVPQTMMSLSDLESQGYVAMAKAAIKAVLAPIVAVPPGDSIVALEIARRELFEATSFLMSTK